MEWLNYHHLLYFWLVAREGSLARASAELRLAPSTLSGQIRVLEESFGEKLFRRSGRTLVLTDVGRVVYRYAEEIFSLGRELQDAVRGRPVGRALELRVGITDVVPKLVAERLLAPALKLAEPIHLICREGDPEQLLAELALHRLDVVLADAPLPTSSGIRAFSHLLKEGGVTFFGTPSLTKAHRKRFPKSLEDAPVLLPTPRTVLRRSLDQWFTSVGIRPRIVGEFDDSALMKVFGQQGLGFFPAPEVIATEVQRQYGVRSIGQPRGVRERFYAITLDRRLKHPAVVALGEAVREEVSAGRKS